LIPVTEKGGSKRERERERERARESVKQVSGSTFNLLKLWRKERETNSTEKLAAAQASVQEYCKQKHAGKEKTVQVI